MNDFGGKWLRSAIYMCFIIWFPNTALICEIICIKSCMCGSDLVI